MVTAPVATSVTAGVGAGHAVHQFARQMLRVADAGRGKRQFAGIGLGVGDQLLGIVHGRGRGHDNHAWHNSNERNRNKFAARIVGHFLFEQMMIDRDLARCGHQQGVTVGRRFRDGARGDHRTGARPVLDEDRLSERRSHRLTQQPRHDVDAAAGRIADKDADWMVGVSRLRARAAHGAGSRRGRRGGEKATSGQHGFLPQFFYMRVGRVSSCLRMILSENRFPLFGIMR